MRAALTISLSGLLAGPALAAEVKVTVEVPRLTVAEYHRPYIAVWLERPDQSHVGNVAVWYQQKDEGTKWLKDMRQWWRRSGREVTMPVDGLSSATRAPGTHTVPVSLDKGAFAGLAPGDYALIVEAAREVGGRELLRIPFQWPPAAEQSLKAQGKHELGAVSLELKS